MGESYSRNSSPYFANYRPRVPMKGAGSDPQSAMPAPKYARRMEDGNICPAGLLHMIPYSRLWVLLAAS
jgi:hypothetical protein